MHEKAAKKARFSCKSTFFGAVFLSAAFRKFFTFLSYSLKPLKFQQFYKLPFQSEFSFWFSVPPLPLISHTFLAQCRLSYTKLLQKKQVFRVNIHLNTPEGYSPSQTCLPKSLGGIRQVRHAHQTQRALNPRRAIHHPKRIKNHTFGACRRCGLSTFIRRPLRTPNRY